MSFASIGLRHFQRELQALLNKKVTVRTSYGKVYTGTLIGYDASSLHLCLRDAEDSEGNKFARVFLNGSSVLEILSTEELIDLRELAERIERVFPHMVKYLEDARVIIVMDRVKVTEDGVVEGTGPIAERVKRIYEEYVAEKRAKGAT